MTTPAARRARIALGGAVKALKLTIKDEDLDAAAQTQEFAMGTLPAGAIVVGFDKDVVEAFVGLTAPDVDLGVAGGVEYLDSSDIDSVERKSGLVAVANSDGNGVAVTATVTDTVDDVVDATAGEVSVQVLYIEAEQVQTAQ